MACTMSFAATDYSKTYTSNVTFSAGENSEAVKVIIGGTSYDGMKAGASKKAGSLKITVPANQTNLHIHAIAWKSVTNAEVSIEGATCTPASLALTANDGISNVAPFTISGDMLDEYYFNIALTGVTAETVLTLSCDKRFVVFGVNAVATADVPATAIELDNTTLELEQYKTAKLVATLTPAEATTPITFASSDENVATVNSNGVVTAVAAGTAQISAKAGELVATCNVTVKEATPITCAEAVEIAKTAAGNNVPAEGGKYVVRGYVTSLYKVPADDFETYGNYSFYMADTKDGGNVFEAYQVKPLDGKTIVKVGDFVEVVGELTKYKETYETMGSGSATVEVIVLSANKYATEDAAAKVEKRIENGQVVIIRNGVRYNAVGAVIE